MLVRDFGSAVALVLVIEGIMPFVNPGRWRNLIRLAAELDTRKIRIMGGVSMLLGLFILYFVRHFI